MHYKIEVVIPPTNNVEESVKQVMDSFLDDDGDGTPHCDWYDWYVIGGRWSGDKLMARCDEEKLKGFNDMLNEEKFTVGSFVCGKEELNPASQIPVVDTLWREWFPGVSDMCPLFQHYWDQYSEGLSSADVCKVSEIPDRLTCNRLIIAEVKHWGDDAGKVLVKDRMLCKEFWNGVEWQDTTFKGNVKEGMRIIAEGKHGEPDLTDRSEWLVVTVDIHN